MMKYKEIAEKQAKILRIIKEKKVYPQRVLMYKHNIRFYNAEVSEDRRLTQEEFDLLVEWLTADEPKEDNYSFKVVLGVKLKEIKKAIKTDLALYDSRGNVMYTNVDVNGELFGVFENYEVIAIRDHTSCTHVDKGIVISIV